MSINFTREEILKAIQKIDTNPKLRTNRHSSTYDLLYNDKSFPPILVLSVANEHKKGNELTLQDFNNNVDVPFKILKDLGFQIISKSDQVNNKKDFKDWLSNNLANNSGAIGSYIIALDWLSNKFYTNKKIDKKSIFAIDDINIINKLYDEAKEKQKDKTSYIYNHNAPSYGENNFYTASLKKYVKFLQYKLQNLSNKKTHIINPKKLTKSYTAETAEFNIDAFTKKLKDSGLIFSDQLVTRFCASLITKPFLILTGLSGSGKTKLAQAFVQWICQDESQYLVIPVGADWTNREPLLGYPNALNPEEYVKPDNGVLDLIIQASEMPDLPHFLILDEMNLSHVERYFADFLSVMESKESIPLYSEGTVENGVPFSLQVPPNLFIIGTVNIDETTNMFSPKVLDRANTLEFRVNLEDMKTFLSDIKDVNMKSLNANGANMAESFIILSKNISFKNKDAELINETLIKFFAELKKTGAEFGYRSASEILRLINQLSILNDELTINEKIDIAIMHKLLPKLHGSRRKLCPVLVTLGKFCFDGEIDVEQKVFTKDDFDYKDRKVLYSLSLEKIARMYRGAIDNGFASFAEA